MLRATTPAPTRTGVVRHLELWAVWPFAVTSGILGAVAIGTIFSSGVWGGGFDGVQLAAVGMVTGLLTYGALRLALRASTPSGVAWATVGSCIFFAAMNSPASYMVVATLETSRTPGSVFGGTVVAGLVGLPFSIPLGCLWALALAGPMFVVAKLREEPTLDGPDRAARAVAGALSVVCGFGGIVALPFDTLPSMLFVICALAGLTVVASTVRLHHLDRFLRRVRRGDAEGWTIMSLAELENVPDDLPSTDLAHHPDGVLVKMVPAGGQGAYRTGGIRRIPWARTRL